MADLHQHLHAALLESGLNLGPTRMVECCSLSYSQLAWATEWYLGDTQLQAANDILVDYLHQLQLAAHWGTGRFSSSDGQRSAARGRVAAADTMAGEFGYKRSALKLVNWVSDQFSQYGTKVVSVAEREAIHTLEAILHTQLPILEHTTDAHGATESCSRSSIFSACGSSRACATPATYSCIASARPPPRRRGAALPCATAAHPRAIRRPPANRGVAQAPPGAGKPARPGCRTRHHNRRWPQRSATTSGSCAPLPARLLRRPRRARARIAGQLNTGETLHALRRHLVIG
jgi:hypothetical protein